MRLITRAVGALTGLVAAGALAPAAMAIPVTASTAQNAGTSAGASHDTGLNLTFSGGTNDSPQHLVINLPPGALANAALNGGRCLQEPASGSPDAGCVVGSGTVHAQTLPIPILGTVTQLNVPVTFYLTKPPSSGDLAGLEVYTTFPGIAGQLGPTGDVLIRPTGDPLGVGATIKLTVPNKAALFSSINLPTTITEIDSTFKALRYPTTCPSAPQRISGTVDGYSSGAAGYSAPLNVTGCSGLAYAPKLSATAARDQSDKGVALTSTITQGASESPNRNVSLAFPTSTVKANLNGLANLCTGSVSGCRSVGSVTAASPLYPTPLTGAAYLTGDHTGLSLTLKFPSPFPLTLVGAVALGNGSASFTGLPDIPLTNLKVTLSGGPNALFVSNCLTPTGTAVADVADQNGDKSAHLTSSFTVSGCPGSSGGGGGTGAGGGTGGGGGTSGGGSGGGTGGSTGSGSVAPTSIARIVSKSAHGLGTRKPSISFRVRAGRKAPKLTRLTVGLPKGLSFVRHRVGRKHKTLKVTGVSLKGARIKSLRLSHKRLVITFKKPSRNILVTLGPKSLRETKAMAASVRKHKLKSLRLKVAARNTRKHTKTLTVKVTKLHL